MGNGSATDTMSFLDSLENNLKALESIEERDPEQVKRNNERREAERAASLSRASDRAMSATSAST